MLSASEFKELSDELRICQREAIAQIDAYLESEDIEKSMLVCLPTGAGKTGVIATVCQRKQSGAVLVLSPRRSVCDQLIEQVGGKFFEDRGVVVRHLSIVAPVNHRAKKSSKMEPASIVIDTFQKIVVMREAAREKYLKQFDLVIVDEGHSEPAPIWGRIVRSMHCKKIIVTATPYRNDLFQFNIGEINYGFTFAKAIKEGVVLEPRFSEVKEENITSLVSGWLEKNDSLKCIVKCKDYHSVRSALRAFRSAGVEALAFHDQFSGSGEAQGMSVVPTGLAARAERVFIHQHKLDEGVDIPNAKLLVLLYPVSSGRELVQAVGRIVRCSPGSPEVWDCAAGSNNVLWSNYREFDSYISDKAEWHLFLRSLDSATLINAYLTAFPQISYFGQNFRSTFDIESFDPDSQLKLPLSSVCFMEVDSKFTLPSFIDTLAWELRGRGELVRVCESSFDLSVIISITFDNSRFLKDQLFFQPRIEVVVAKMAGNMLALLDSRSIDHSSRPELGTRRPVDVTSLLKLASRDKARRTRETHARSVSTSRKRAEVISLRGADLELVGSNQANANYALSITKVDNLDARNNRTSSYYLGIGSGRVSDQKRRNFSLKDLSTWIDEVTGVMASSGNVVSGIFSSFALPLSGEVPNEVLSLTIDLNDLESEIVVRHDDREVEVKPDFYFEKVVGGKVKVSGIPLKIARDGDTGALILESEKAWTIKTDGVGFEKGDDFVEWINRKDIKALLDGGVSYLNGKYYLISLPTQKGFDLTTSVLGRQFTAVDELQTSNLSEKGEPVGGAFATDSIFDIIDGLLSVSNDGSQGLRRAQAEVMDADIVVCTDMGTEAADFIVSSPRKLIYIHAKCGRGRRPKSSAGAIAEVGSQAIKNIEQLISKDKSLEFGNRTLLDGRWPHEGHPDGLDRLRVFRDKSGNERSRVRTRKGEAIDIALEIIVDRRRSDACEKEIWIMVGRAFSLGHFTSQMAKGADANSESLQAFQLISSWDAVARANDITLRFFVSP